MGRWAVLYPEPLLLTRGNVVSACNPALLLLAGHVDSAMVTGQPLTKLLLFGQGVGVGFSWLPGRLRCADGEIPIEIMVLPSGSAGPDEHVVFLRDMRARLADQQGLEKARVQAERDRNAARQFLAQMTHELRTPLNAVIGFSEIMVQQLFGPLDARYRDYAEDIMHSGRHLLGIINDILDLSKIEAGEMTLDEQTLDLERIIASSLRLVTERAASGHVALTLHPDSVFPPLHGDEIKLKQLFLNLLSNAIKFTPAGGAVQIRTRLERNGQLSVIVQDTGIGMDPAQIATAMLPFKQLHSGIKHDDRGTGLGLTISKAIATLHGGSLELTSNVGQGTTALVRLPANRLIRVS
ncbi:sensor histidine kinase [Oceanibaculum pacificum]|uniref:histidine kinase n=1 Tax=Oceanibaculum pacificum TaxID=580166 RepID=A0A154VQX9_9PROT|nr:HAMP domain-containing sensor histidine kinase [Oceanibaculum pacificum]KZD03713.1 hypothetical protein AUP43_12620 [Oceanibaculum pacificum]